jgi:glycosyltransferase involved in cell wall biosynthesis
LRIAYLSIGRHLHTERWIGHFAAKGHDCHLLTVQPGPIEGVTVHDIRTRAPSKPLRYWRTLHVVRSLLDRLQPALLNTHFLTGYGYWGHFSGFHPNVLTVWGDDVYVTPHESPLKGWLARRALSSADAVTGDSVDVLRGCVALGADAGRCYEVQWGVDFRRFHPGRTGEVRTELGIPPEAPVIFSPRSFTQPYYNLDVIIAACARLLGLRPGVHVIFAGYEGDQEPFRRRAASRGLTGNTHFVGRIPHERFGAFLAETDVFVSVPSVDATAVSLLEAMACGCGIVVSALPSSLEWIEAEVTGEVVPPRDEEALLAALIRLVDEPERRRRYGDRAMAVARDRADHARQMDRVEALYTHLVTGAPRNDAPASLAARGLA